VFHTTRIFRQLYQPSSGLHDCFVQIIFTNPDGLGCS